MIETGSYQNEIPSLSALNVTDYERIFKLFKASVDDKEFYYYNILKKIDFPILDSQYIDYYEVKSDMPMTTLSYRIYGDIKSWWIIYLLNKDIFKGEAPFIMKGGNQVAFIKNSVRSLIYSDITQGTVFGGRHF